jgi:hypothetical protein
MATSPGTIKHRKHSFIASVGADIDTPHWNDSEVMAGGVNGQACVRDTAQADGWGWQSLLDSPALTGTPTTPTPATNNSSAQIANTFWVLNQLVVTTTPIAWTPIDASGAGLTLTGSGQYIVIGKLVMFTVSFTYPTTSNTATAYIGGLPYVSAVQSAGVLSYSEYAPAERLFIQINQAYLQPAPSPITNANMSGKTFIGNGWYFRS